MTSLTASPILTRPQRWPWLAAALTAGLAVGWLDRSATEVQGPLLLLMLAAFALSIPRGAPAWAIALATAVGLPLAHVAGHALGDPAGASWGMLIAVVPAGIAAYVGAAVGAVTRQASTLVDRRILIGAALGACAAAGAGPVYASLVARGQPNAWWVATIWQVMSLVAWTAITPAVLYAWRIRHVADTVDTGSPHLLTHAAAAVGIAALHATLMPLATIALFIPLGATTLAGAMAWAFATYLPLDLLTYGAVVGAAYLADADRRTRAAATRESAARGELAVARLAGLRAQLRPHFLFNALNTAAVLATRGDTEGTRRVLAGLGELLRYVMRGGDEPETTPSQMVSLREEIAFVEQYLAIERERFPELRITVDVADDVRDAQVPALILQPLVENAIRHGLGGRIGAGSVTVRARRSGASLHVTVVDDGPGPAEPNVATPGIGLANTRARLLVLYGGAASVTLETGAGGGAVAAVVIPCRV